jgi:hypothetical protein
VRKSDIDKADRLNQVEAELAKTRQSDQEKSRKISDAESQLAQSRQAAQESSTRLTKLDNELAEARHSADQAKAVAGQLQAAQRPRTITAEQRLTFLETVRGLSRGKVIVSAIFFNKETHDFGRQITKLLSEAGFSLIESEPLNFFTTSRPPSGIRIGFKGDNSEPPQVETLLKGFRAMGLDPSETTLVNSDAEDVVEIQVTPRE